MFHRLELNIIVVRKLHLNNRNIAQSLNKYLGYTTSIISLQQDV